MLKIAEQRGDSMGAFHNALYLGDVPERVKLLNEAGKLEYLFFQILLSAPAFCWTQPRETIEDGNKSSGGLKLKCSAWALLGFIRFTSAYYMLLVTKRSSVANIGGHFIYQIDGTELIPLVTTTSSRAKLERNPEEARYLGILNNLDLSRSFYFSNSIKLFFYVYTTKMT